MITPATLTLSITDPNELSDRQASSVAPSLGDSRADQSSLIRELIREELLWGLGRRGHRSEREDSGSSPSSHEVSHLQSCLLVRFVRIFYDISR